MPVIEVDNLVKRYDDVPVVDGVSFTVEKGEIFAILGPNGAGKTTTVESIAGLRQPDGGRISVLGRDPRTTPPRCESVSAFSSRRAVSPIGSRFGRRST